DGQQFYTLARPSQVIIWDTRSGAKKSLAITGREAATRPNSLDSRAAKAVDLSRDDKTFIAGDPFGLSVCDEKGQVRYEIANPTKGPIDPGNIKGDRLLFGGHYSYGRISPDGKSLAVVLSSSPNEIQLRNLATGDELLRFSTKGRLVRLAFSPDGKQIVT